MNPTDSETACFEAGIKFGALYHQFEGTPVSPGSATSLENAMEEAIENQPYCEAVTVTILTDEFDMRRGYTSLSGEIMEVTMRIKYEDHVVRTEMKMEDGYPLMCVVSVDED